MPRAGFIRAACRPLVYSTKVSVHVKVQCCDRCRLGVNTGFCFISTRAQTWVIHFCYHSNAKSVLSWQKLTQKDRQLMGVLERTGVPGSLSVSSGSISFYRSIKPTMSRTVNLVNVHCCSLIIGVYMGKNRDERAGEMVVLASRAAQLKDLLTPEMR